MTMWAIIPEHLDRIRLALDAGQPENVPPKPMAAWGTVSLLPGEDDDRRPYAVLPDGTAVISFNGPVFSDSTDWWKVWLSGGVTYGQLVHMAQMAVEDPRVTAWKFDVDSPGGEATGLPEAEAALLALAQEKPYAGSYARGNMASAAYRLLCRLGPINASPMALTGCIGVRFDLFLNDRRLKDIGIETEVLAEEWNAYLNRINQTRDFDMFVLGWSSSIEPNGFGNIFGSKGTQNSTGYANEQVDKLFDQAANVPGCSQADRQKVYAQIQKIVAEDAPYVFMYVNENIDVFNKRIQVNPLKKLGAGYEIEKFAVAQQTR